MKEQFVTYEIALALKELGFDEECFAFYLFDKQLQLSCAVYNTNSYWEDSKLRDISAPLWQQVIDWFRVKYNYDIHITFKHQEGVIIDGLNSVYYDIEIYYLTGGDALKAYNFSKISDSYYYAREYGILTAIKLINKL